MPVGNERTSREYRLLPTDAADGTGAVEVTGGEKD